MNNNINNAYETWSGTSFTEGNRLAQTHRYLSVVVSGTLRSKTLEN